MASSFIRFFDVFSARPSGSDAAKHGSFAIPGESVVELPQGRVRIYYEKAEGEPGDDSGFKPPDSLQVKVASADSGEELPVRHKLPFGEAAHETAQFGRSYVGRIEVQSAGRYRVEASVETDDPSPHLALGK